MISCSKFLMSSIFFYKSLLILVSLNDSIVNGRFIWMYIFKCYIKINWIQVKIQSTVNRLKMKIMNPSSLRRSTDYEAVLSSIVSPPPKSRDCLKLRFSTCSVCIYYSAVLPPVPATACCCWYIWDGPYTIHSTSRIFSGWHCTPSGYSS